MRSLGFICFENGAQFKSRMQCYLVWSCVWTSWKSRTLCRMKIVCSFFARKKIKCPFKLPNESNHVAQKIPFGLIVGHPRINMISYFAFKFQFWETSWWSGQTSQWMSYSWAFRDDCGMYFYSYFIYSFKLDFLKEHVFILLENFYNKLL